ncbi:MAG: YraN family protein [Chloroflexi bacterium]|nr:YraN family protein [Chloroflexota bacterium]
MTDGRRALGRAAEEYAAAYLQRHGYVIVARNWRCAAGELDLVARDGAALVFIEVRASRQNLGRALESIGPVKQRRLATLAYAYLAAHPPAPSDWRIDVVALAWCDDGWRVHHLRAAVGE